MKSIPKTPDLMNIKLALNLVNLFITDPIQEIRYMTSALITVDYKSIDNHFEAGLAGYDLAGIDINGRNTYREIVVLYYYHDEVFKTFRLHWNDSIQDWITLRE